MGLNLLNLSFMVKGSTKVHELKLQYWVSSIIKFYSLLVIIANVLVLAYGQKLEKPEYEYIKTWLKIIGLKANDIELAGTNNK